MENRTANTTGFKNVEGLVMEAAPKRKRQRDHIITQAKVLSDTEVQSLRVLCKRYLDIERDERNALMILIALQCGLRASELLGITVGGIMFSRKPAVYIDTLKGGRAREMPLTMFLADRLEKYIMRMNPAVDHIKFVPKDQKVFPISYARLEQIWAVMRPNPNKTFHSLRHTFAVETFLKNRDVIFLQRALGHRSVVNTMVYADFVYANTEMRKVLADE